MSAMSALTQFCSSAISKMNGFNAEGPNVIVTGDFRINISERTAEVCGHELNVTAEEFDVLLFLIQHPRQLVTPRSVLSTKPEGTLPRHTDILRVLLSLRKKLDEAGCGKRYLQTEPWILYRFDASSPSSH